MTETVLDAHRRRCSSGRGRRAAPDQVAPAARAMAGPRERVRETVDSHRRGRCRCSRSAPTIADSAHGSGDLDPMRACRARSGSERADERPPVIYLPGFARDADPRRRSRTGRAPAAGGSSVPWRRVAPAERQGVDGRRLPRRSLRGLDLEVAKDAATRDGDAARAFPRLLDEPVVGPARRGARSRRSSSTSCSRPTMSALLLLWLNDPAGRESGTEPVQWSAFRDTCKGTLRLRSGGRRARRRGLAAR